MNVIYYLVMAFLYFIILYICEIIIAGIFYYFLTFDIKSILMVLLFNYLRLIFFSIPMLILYLIFIKDFLSINIKYKPFLISVFNLIILLLFLIFTELLFYSNKFNLFKNPIVITSILGIFIAPMVVCLIPYYKIIVSKFNFILLFLFYIIFSKCSISGLPSLYSINTASNLHILF